MQQILDCSVRKQKQSSLLLENENYTKNVVSTTDPRSKAVGIVKTQTLKFDHLEKKYFDEFSELLRRL
jgi:hypothetical protein